MLSSWKKNKKTNNPIEDEPWQKVSVELILINLNKNGKGGYQKKEDFNLLLSGCAKTWFNNMNLWNLGSTSERNKTKFPNLRSQNIKDYEIIFPTISIVKALQGWIQGV